ncbi:holo-ACP synthase [bacterium]|nr:holo-ACP synthase [bacterium]
MILGTGIDLLDPRRLRKAADRWGDRLLDRLFTPGERSDCEGRGDPWPSFAARFAAKEAFVKALGLGLRHGLTWKQIEVVYGEYGKPELRLSGKATELLSEQGVMRAHLSLSHQAGMAMAMVILEGDPK